MNCLDKLKDGLTLEKVFSNVRETPYKFLYIVSADKKDALLHYSENQIKLVSEWYNVIDDFENIIFTKVHRNNQFNYLKASGELVSPLWSDEIEKYGCGIWPLEFNGRYNFIDKNGNIFLEQFYNDIWLDREVGNRYILRLEHKILNSYYGANSQPSYSYYCMEMNGKVSAINYQGPILANNLEDLYTSDEKLTERLSIKRTLLYTSVKLSDKSIIENCSAIIKYPSLPINEELSMQEGRCGILFSVKKSDDQSKNKLSLEFRFVTVLTKEGNQILCLSTESFLPGIYEDVQVLPQAYIKVKKDGHYNLIDRFGDILSPEAWYDDINLLDNGYSIVSSTGKYNILKPNGKLVSDEWFDKVDWICALSIIIVSKDGLYNGLDSNMLFICPEWKESIELVTSSVSQPTDESKIVTWKTWNTVSQFSDIWVKLNDSVLEGWVIAKEDNSMDICFINALGNLQDLKVTREMYTNPRSVIKGQFTVYFNKFDVIKE